MGLTKKQERKKAMAKNKSKNEAQHDIRIRPQDKSATTGANTPEIEPPAFNPPVPNRAWTEMKKDIEGKTK